MFNPRAKDTEFSSMYDLPNEDMKLKNWSCMLNCCIECTGVFVPYAEINNEKYVDLPFIFSPLRKCNFFFFAQIAIKFLWQNTFSMQKYGKC